ncbi:hypothetical protein QTJ16_001593 [Diplocarpon rosae]|uniref:Uncharacterized protein n=1 Tax=Diplocarpon rosae TaxID=946125 RepID=A0AAD9T550_9HELO|nr:hypothetical protein QTJ16_001593 [Diplocarpon rosae]
MGNSSSKTDRAASLGRFTLELTGYSHKILSMGIRARTGGAIVDRALEESAFSLAATRRDQRVAGSPYLAHPEQSSCPLHVPHHLGKL